MICDQTEQKNLIRKVTRFKSQTALFVYSLTRFLQTQSHQQRLELPVTLVHANDSDRNDCHLCRGPWFLNYMVFLNSRIKGDLPFALRCIDQMTVLCQPPSCTIYRLCNDLCCDFVRSDSQSVSSRNLNSHTLRNLFNSAVYLFKSDL